MLDAMNTSIASDVEKPDHFEQLIHLPYSSVGPSGRLRPDRLIRLFQDVSSTHCYQLGCSALQLAPGEVKWVISRYQIRFLSIPRWPDLVKLRTWRRPWKNLYDLRYLCLEDPEGKHLIHGVSFWNLIKADSGRPVRLSHYMPPERLGLEPDRIPEFWENEHKEIQADHTCRFSVEARELDMNQHVNNTAYITWAMNPLPLEFLSAHLPQTMTVSYLKETFYRDKMVSAVEEERFEDRTRTRHLITNETTGTPVARLTMDWKGI